MSRKFFDALRRFEETHIGMSGRSSMVVREEWMGTPETDQQRCTAALETLASVWNQAPQDLVTLRQMTSRCLDIYVTGELNAGDFAVRDIDEFLSGVRDSAAAVKLK
jgi:hypothetical protein